jgi:hypothetical protein
MGLMSVWGRMVRDVADLPLWKILRLRGTGAIAKRQPDALELAVDRCRACGKMAKCQELVAGGRDREIEAFCPNVMYLKHLEAMKRHAPKKDLLGPS